MAFKTTEPTATEQLNIIQAWCSFRTSLQRIKETPDYYNTANILKSHLGCKKLDGLCSRSLICWGISSPNVLITGLNPTSCTLLPDMVYQYLSETDKTPPDSHYYKL